MAKENVQRLLGEGVESTILESVVNIIKSNEYVKDVKEIKAVMIGSVKFRFFAEITYDIEVKKKNIYY